MNVRNKYLIWKCTYKTEPKPTDEIDIYPQILEKYKVIKHYNVYLPTILNKNEEGKNNNREQIFLCFFFF